MAGLKLGAVGALGLMLSPSAKHLLQASATARYVRIHDRGTGGTRRDSVRQDWRDHGAHLVPDFQQLVGDGDLDGIVVCAGKNGDDCSVIKELVPLLKKYPVKKPFILHLSTLSSQFVTLAHAFCTKYGIGYANYPLTGGPAGAAAATMLILASGDHDVYDRVLPMLSLVGTPKYYGDSLTLGAEVKLLGHVMVFGGCIGICSAAALQSACFGVPLGDSSQEAFFDFLNTGAGGTRQWDVALKKGIAQGAWDQGFMIHHAVVDAIYTAQLLHAKGLPLASLLNLINVALGFAFVIKQHPESALCTHALARELQATHKQEYDEFWLKAIGGRDLSDVPALLQTCLDLLPPRISQTAMLSISASDFES